MGRRWPRLEFSAEALREVVRERGMTAEELGREAGLSERMVDGLMRGDFRSPLIWAYYRIADVLGMTLDELFEETFEAVPRA